MFFYGRGPEQGLRPFLLVLGGLRHDAAAPPKERSVHAVQIQKEGQARRQIRESEEKAARAHPQTYRTLLLAHAERLESQHHAGGVQAPLRAQTREYRQRRAVRAVI